MEHSFPGLARPMRARFKRFARNLLLAGGLLPSLASAAIPPVPVYSLPPGSVAPINDYSGFVEQYLSLVINAGAKSFLNRKTGRIVPLERLRSQVHRVRFYHLDRFTKPAGATRWSGFNDPRHRAVYLNKRTNIDPRVLSALLFHEVLGALGYYDEDYRISILSYLYLQADRDSNVVDADLTQVRAELSRLLVTAPAPLSQEELRYPSIKRANGRLALGGGADVVGSGGDGAALLFKILLIEDSLGGLAVPTLENMPLLRRGLDLRIELFNDGRDRRDPAACEVYPCGARLFGASNIVYMPRSLVNPRNFVEANLAERELARLRGYLRGEELPE
jgi:hypothetical protein